MPFPRFPSLRRVIWLPVGAALLLAPAVLAVEHHAASAKPVEVPRLLVQTAVASRADIPVNSTLSGTLAPFQQAKLYAMVAGYLKAIYVDKGDRVKAGQLLAVIEAPELKAQLSAARSKTMQARAALLERQADEQKARAERDITALAYRRLHGARRQSPELIAPMEEDVARSKAVEAVAVVGIARSRVAAARAELASQRAAERQSEEQLAYTRIVAPFSGVITARCVDPGAMVQAGVSSASQAPPVVELVDPDRLRLDVHVAETDVPYVKAGTPVTISLPSVPGSHRRSTIKRTSLAEATDTRTMLAEAELDNHDHAWNPGMYAHVTLQLQIHRQVLTLPDTAIVRHGEKASVYVLGPDQVLHRKAIELGADDGIRAEVTRGIASGDTVVIPGTEPLKEGLVVRRG